MMILVTGGLGFIGSHTVRALLDLGEDCVVVQRHARELPAVLAGARVEVEQADVTDRDALLAIGHRHDITGIVHLAGSYPWPPVPDAPVEATRQALGGLLNIAQAAQEWGVRRLGVASTIGVYFGATDDGPLREDAPLPMSALVSIPTFKKVGELLGGFLADTTGIDIVNYRVSGTWGPLGHPDPFFAAPALIHAAARGTAPDLSNLVGPAFAEDGLDLNYVKDTGRAIALLQLAGKLNHRTYNVGSGRATTNAQLIEAIKKVVPDARVGLPNGGDAPHLVLDISRLQEDTGYQAEYDTERAVSDYIAWLRAGNKR
ncbi:MULTISPECIES: NAD-dependent epimerase/dehydratase family protein [unclassified Streptomyces]|uniref:NAD-dependent epimerase/dehydratase family protein n=1 Tax=unclassified Streptomyces TaxID=2593676 RepID=UPI002DDB4AD1|nr:MULTISPECIES: NAD(P)-dependent oxidoreductase [unclassified Streptomyces]WSF89304.1 NAD(P)-dependent oxidoreductase [Streptomyces sp. NBC_01744]WSC34525.1 NAD(P)-dependent oxidoreductase [Streptomyces sp. NBC_01763]WSC42936.1 NAD(P)-dependent oxidoreductase [Streptomyces sp. NBC_01762]WSC58202.1 NAD(P)-dependent oxidoreductase [Streptomyces sp. NBC_01761]WSD22472.1 NAD(P)-dependent oxidoreductase [Streptomyces sp. NBC_01751]